MMGPVVSEAQRNTIEAYIKSAIDEGATLLTGGQRPTEPPLDRGWYVTPTVFTDVTHNMTITREEVFDPWSVSTRSPPTKSCSQPPMTPLSGSAPQSGPGTTPAASGW